MHDLSRGMDRRDEKIAKGLKKVRDAEYVAWQLSYSPRTLSLSLSPVS